MTFFRQFNGRTSWPVPRRSLELALALRIGQRRTLRILPVEPFGVFKTRLYAADEGFPVCRESNTREQ